MVKARRSPFPRVLAIFVATILAPGAALALLALRTLFEERRRAGEQIRERLETEARAAVERAGREFAAWRAAAAPGGDAVLLRRSGQRCETVPPLPYRIGEAPSAASPPDSAAWREAEALERQPGAAARAAESYRLLLASASAQARPWVLHRLARTLRKAGREEDALAAYRRLREERSVWIGTLPADLIALHEIAALEKDASRRAEAGAELYRGLVEGRWPVERASYVFYASQAKAWLPELEKREAQRLALAEAVEQYLGSGRALVETPRGFWLALAEPSTGTVALVSAESIGKRVWPGPAREIRAVLSAGGRTLFGDGPPAGRTVVTHTLDDPDVPLRIQVWAADPDSMLAAETRRGRLYLGLVALVAALLGFGGYLTVRTVRAELAMAQLKADFVSTVSHEFRSPLTGILQLGEMLDDGRVKDEDRRRDYYRMIVAESRRLRRLIENVLDFARMEEGRHQFRFEPIETSPWLRELAEEFGSEIAPAGYRLEAEVPERLPPVSGDREALATAIHNLVDNAVKYSPDSREVGLRARAEGRELQIAVSDRGIGIAEEERRRIFDKFYRARGETARQVKGAGLGLSLVKQIVAAHGGAVECASRPGEGSTFTIRLKTMESA